MSFWRKKEKFDGDGLGGIPVKPIEKDIKIIDESKHNIPSQPDPYEASFGEDPGGHDGSVTGIIYRAKEYKRTPSELKKIAREHGKEIAITTGGVLFVIGTVFAIGHKDEIKKLKKLWKK